MLENLIDTILRCRISLFRLLFGDLGLSLAAKSRPPPNVRYYVVLCIRTNTRKNDLGFLPTNPPPPPPSQATSDKSFECATSILASFDIKTMRKLFVIRASCALEQSYTYRLEMKASK